MSKDKRPSLQFYPGDWKKDPAVTCLSLPSKALWFEMLLIMFDSPERGHLKHSSGKPISDEQLARMVGASVCEVRKCLTEMNAAGTYSVSGDGTIFCRRMVRDEEIRKVRQEAGKLGGNPKLLGKVNPEVNQTANQILTPSSSSSFSTSVGSKPNLEPNQTAAEWLADSLATRHPKKGDRNLVEHAVVEILSAVQTDEERLVLAGRIDHVHQAWCKSESWRSQGGKFAPKLSRWLIEGGWRDEPPGSNADGLDPRIAEVLQEMENVQ